MKSVNDYIKTFKEMKIREANREQWSYYYEAIKEGQVTKAINEGVPVLDIIERGIKKGEIKDSHADIRKLKHILKDKVATQKWVKGESLHRAEKIAITRNPEQEDQFLQDLKDMTTVLENVNKEKIDSIKKNPRKLKIVENFLDSAKVLSKCFRK